MDVTTIKNFSADARNIQFPTVTICPKGWANDRWGYIKGYLNEYDLDNEGYTQEIYNKWKFYMVEYYNIYQNALQIGIKNIDAIIKSKYRVSKLGRFLKEPLIAKLEGANDAE